MALPLWALEAPAFTSSVSTCREKKKKRKRNREKAKANEGKSNGKGKGGRERGEATRWKGKGGCKGKGKEEALFSVGSECQCKVEKLLDVEKPREIKRHSVEVDGDALQTVGQALCRRQTLLDEASSSRGAK